VREVTGSWK